MQNTANLRDLGRGHPAALWSGKSTFQPLSQTLNGGKTLNMQDPSSSTGIHGVWPLDWEITKKVSQAKNLQPNLDPNWQETVFSTKQTKKYLSVCG